MPDIVVADTHTGVMNVLMKAKKQRLIPFAEQLMQRLEEIQFRFSSALQKYFLEQAREL